MSQAATVADFVAAPVGRYVSTGSAVVWMQNPSRLGMFLTGPLNAADVASLGSLGAIYSHSDVKAPFDVLHDLSALTVFDDTTLAQFERWYTANSEAGRVRRIAVVRAGGLASPSVAKLFAQVIASGFDAKLCATRTEAYEFLEISDEDGNALDPLAGESPRMRQFRDRLLGEVANASLARSAAGVGLSTRSLQRLLAGHRTTFRRELAKARIRRAQTILLECEDKLEAIARELGFSSASNFSTMFARAVGQSPGAFRTRYRAR